MNITPQQRIKIQRTLIAGLQDKVQDLERRLHNQSKTINARQSRIDAMEQEIIRLRKMEKEIQGWEADILKGDAIILKKEEAREWVIFKEGQK